MDAESHHFSTPRTARYWTLGPPPAEALGTLYALHGYGQLAPYFVRKFQPIADAGWHVVAPEGGHRFYLKGTSGRVGASWMTKEDRLSDIADYVGFLDALRTRIDGGQPQGRQVLLGFSQGVATALRWLALGERPVGSWHGVVAHSGVLPPDLPKSEQAFASAPNLHLITGTEDPYILDVEAGFRSSMRDWLDCGGQTEKVIHHTFSGGHTVDAPTVEEVLSSMRNAL
jgi:predicted esterase